MNILNRSGLGALIIHVFVIKKNYPRWTYEVNTYAINKTTTTKDPEICDHFVRIKMMCGANKVGRSKIRNPQNWVSNFLAAIRAAL